MGRDLSRWDPRRRGWVSRSNVPVVVVSFALVCWLFASNGVYVEPDYGAGVMFNPLSYVLSMVLHFDRAHFASNMRWWIPFGTLFTLLTSNRHLLVVAVVSHVATQVASNALFRFGAGLSVVVFAVLTAALVRSIGYAFQNRSIATLQTGLAVLLVPVLAGVFLIVVAVGPSGVGHLEHFFGALFGAAIETMYVLNGHEGDPTDRGVPHRLHR